MKSKVEPHGTVRPLFDWSTEEYNARRFKLSCKLREEEIDRVRGASIASQYLHNKSKKRKQLTLTFIILVLLTLFTLGAYFTSHVYGAELMLEGPYKVSRVIDGDTIEIIRDGSKVRVRLLCVDTPESVHPMRERNTEEGRQASAFTKERLTDRWVLLQFEGRKMDRWGRLLAYVYINYNVELVIYNHSPYYTKYGTSSHFHEAFIEAEGR